MDDFDPEHVMCPYCGKAELRPLRDNGKIILYNCYHHCGRKFVPVHEHAIDEGVVYYVLKEKNISYGKPGHEGERLAGSGIAFGDLRHRLAACHASHVSTIPVPCIPSGAGSSTCHPAGECPG
jgi:hypothetical protein